MQFEAELAKRDAVIAELAARVEELSARAAPPEPEPARDRAASGASPEGSPADTVGFDSEDRIRVSAPLVRAAFTENPRLAEYCHLRSGEQADADTVAAFVLEILVDLVRRAHEDPRYRNVYLDPSRADQVMARVGEKDWGARPLAGAIRLLFDDAARGIYEVVAADQEQLPLGVRSAAARVPGLYALERERFVREGHAPMSAHLAGTAPAFDITTLVVPR